MVLAAAEGAEVPYVMDVNVNNTTISFNKQGTWSTTASEDAEVKKNDLVDMHRVDMHIDPSQVRAELMKSDNPWVRGVLLDHDTYAPLRPQFVPAPGRSYHDIAQFELHCSAFDFDRIVAKTQKQHVDGSPKQGAYSYSLDETSEETQRLRWLCVWLFQERGMVVFRKTGIVEKYGATAAWAILGWLPDLVTGGSKTDYTGGINFRGTLAENVYDTGAPLFANLHYHHEMIYMGQSIETISFFALKMPTAPNAGSTYVACAKSVTDEMLRRPLGQKMKKLGVVFVKRLPDLEHFKQMDNNTEQAWIKKLVFNYWQTCYDADTAEEAELRWKEKGIQKVEWAESPLFGKQMVTYYFQSGFEYCPFHKENLAVTTVASTHHWFDSWPGVMDLIPEERPFSLLWGDLTEFSEWEKVELCWVYDSFGTEISWSPGDMAVICNYRFAHGRPAVSVAPGQDRKIGVKLGNKYSRQGYKAEG